MKGEKIMKSSKKVERFDYSKYESKYVWDHELLKQYEFWGFHHKKGRLHIDTKRYKKACEAVGITDFLPEGLFGPRSTVYFTPSKIHRDDYKVNIFRDLISELQRQWEEEYKPVFAKIKTPGETFDNYRTGAMMYTSSADDLDEIEVEARMAAFRREAVYYKVLNELYCMFLQKITTEIDRFTLIFMMECGYKGTDFSFENFLVFTEKIVGSPCLEMFKKIEGYNCYSLLHKINNFLKHNSRESYKALAHTFPKNVRSIKNGNADREYENGMFAGDWIVLKDGYLDKVFSKLIRFFENYCGIVLKEDLEQSKWNYDDYFYDAQKEMRYPEEYLGIPY